jgi:hypothetical protein
VRVAANSVLRTAGISAGNTRPPVTWPMRCIAAGCASSRSGLSHGCGFPTRSGTPADT